MRFINDVYEIEASIMYLKSRKALRLSMSIIKLNLASERAVQVHADRKRCRLTVAAEHNVEQKPDKRNGYPVVKSYLEMQEGKNFKLCIEVKKPRLRTDALQIHLWIDGRDFHSEILEDSASDRKRTYERSEVYTVENGMAMCGTLQFSGLNRTSEEAEVEITGSGLGDLCSIVVLIDAGEIRKCKRCLPRLAPEDTEVQLGKVLETEMKMGSSVTVNKLEPRAPDEYTIHFDPIEDSEVCSFVWKSADDKYYTRDILEIKKIVEPKPPRLIARPPSRLRNERASRAAFGKRLGLPPIAEAAGGDTVPPEAGPSKVRRRRQKDERLPIPAESKEKMMGKRKRSPEYSGDEAEDEDESDEGSSSSDDSYAVEAGKKVKTMEFIDLTGEDDGDQREARTTGEQ